MRSKTFGLILFLILGGTIAGKAQAQEHRHQSPHDVKSSDTDAMNKRGEHVMGFDQTKTTHHFLLASDGGTIQVEANDANDTVSLGKIRKHLGHIAEMFGEGNFKAPILIHSQTPSGVEVMKREKAKIEYLYTETERGGSVDIKTNDPNALSAVHEFLRFQIEEHQTGDSLVVP